MTPAFSAIKDAVAAKQAYETRQIKTLVHGPEGGVDMETTVSLTEKARAGFVAALEATRVPVDYEILIAPVEESGAVTPPQR